MYHICPALARTFPKEAKKIRFCLFVPVFDLPVPAEEAGKEIDIQPHNYAEQRGENAYRRPGRTVAYIGAEFWDTAKRVPFVIAVRVESEGPMQELHPGDQTWYISEDGCTLEQLPFLYPQPQRGPGPHLPGAGHWPRVQPAGQKVQ